MILKQKLICVLSAQGSKSFAERILYVTMLLVLFCAESITAQEYKVVLFEAGKQVGTNGSYKKGDSIKNAGVTISGPYAALKGTPYKFYSALTFSVDSGTITQVTITYDKSSTGQFASSNVGSFVNSKDNTGTWTGNRKSFILIVNQKVFVSKIEVVYYPQGYPVIPTTLTFEAPSDKIFCYDDKGFHNFKNAARLSPSVKGAVIKYYSSDTSRATLPTTGWVQIKTKKLGDVVITAKYAGTEFYAPSEASYTIHVVPSLSGKGTQSNPYTVNDVAILRKANVLPADTVFVKGIVGAVKSRANDIIQQRRCDYYVKDELAGTDSLLICSGMYLGKADVILASQIECGDQVVLCGKLDKIADNATGEVDFVMAHDNFIDRFWGHELSLDETLADNYVSEMRHATVKLTRTFNAKAWNSLVLPFDMTCEQVTHVFGDTVKVASYKGTTPNADGTYTLLFEPTAAIVANEPVFIYGATNAENVELEDVSIVNAPPMVTPSGAAFSFVGNYDKETLQPNDWFISSDNNFYHANGKETIKAMRAVFRAVAPGAEAKISGSTLGNIPTGIGIVHSGGKEAVDCQTYNMIGQRVSNSYRGIVIKDGRKYFRR